MFLKKNYADEPLFANSKIVYSVYDDDFPNELDVKTSEKLSYEEGIKKEDLASLDKPNFENLSKLALEYSDAAIIGSENINGEVKKHLATINKPVLDFQSEETYIEKYNEFYDQILN